MSRLTYLNQDTETTELTQFEGDSWQELIKNADAVDQIFIHNAIDKLYEYEELEEQGLLLKLPCKIGSIVYVVGTKCLAGEEPIGGCNNNVCDGCIINKTYTVFETDVDAHLMKLLLFEHNENFIFNKTVFLTREEAEKALKEMEGAE